MKKILNIKFDDILQAERRRENKIETWTLTSDFHYSIFYKKENYPKYFFVPKGFESDGASVPRIFWSIYPPWGKYAEAAVLHDYHYRTISLSIKRKEADKIFLIGMKELEVGFFSRHIIYRAVRIFAYFTWKKYRRKI